MLRPHLVAVAVRRAADSFGAVTEARGALNEAAALPQTVLPPSSQLPAWLLTARYLTDARRLMSALTKQLGPVFTMNIPGFGPSIVVCDPAVVKQVFQAPREVLAGVEPNLSVVTGPGSTFGMQGEDHQRRRKILVPPFHGKRMRAYCELIEEEVLRVSADWPECHEFPVLPSMLQVGLNTILRAVFGADDNELDTLRRILPGAVDRASRLAMVPWLRHDFGRWSPWRRYLDKREAVYRIFDSMVARAKQDPNLEQRTDVLAMLVQAEHEDGSKLGSREIAEELFTLMGAGHETTATAVAWAVERLRRHPESLARLVEEVDAGDSTYLNATIAEVLRVRNPIDSVARRVVAPTIALGPWTIPNGYTVVVNLGLCQLDATDFPDPEHFDPDRFVGASPNPYAWVPFGGGVRRCPGAAFAQYEMAIILRTLLRDFTVLPTSAPDEEWASRGVAYAPAEGGMLMVRRRRVGQGTLGRDVGAGSSAR